MKSTAAASMSAPGRIRRGPRRGQEVPHDLHAGDDRALAEQLEEFRVVDLLGEAGAHQRRQAQPLDVLPQLAELCDEIGAQVTGRRGRPGLAQVPQCGRREGRPSPVAGEIVACLTPPRRAVASINIRA